MLTGCLGLAFLAASALPALAYEAFQGPLGLLQKGQGTYEGYTLLADAIEFTLTTDGECKRDATDFGDVQYDSTTGVYNIALTINNRKSFELPHTGADAPSLWLLIGLPALVAVLLVLVFRYNKKGGRRQ